MRATYRFIGLLLLALLVFPFAASAHRLDECLQATLAAIEPGSVRLQIALVPGVAVADQLLASIDLDRDGVISTNEATAYAEALKRDLTLRLDGRTLELKLTSSECPAPDDLRTGLGIIQIEYFATHGSLTDGSHTLAFVNRHLPAVSVYLLNALQPKSRAVRILSQKRTQTQSEGEIQFSLQQPAKAFGTFAVAAPLTALLCAILVGIRGKAMRSAC